MKLRFVLSMLACLAGAQTISVPLNRTVNLALDEADFTITVAATLDSTVQQVKQALEDAGLPNPTVVALGLDPDPANYAAAPQILYQATLTLAAGSARDAAKRLDNLPSQPPAPLSSLTYSASLKYQPGRHRGGAAVRPVANAGRCPDASPVAGGGGTGQFRRGPRRRRPSPSP